MRPLKWLPALVFAAWLGAGGRAAAGDGYAEYNRALHRHFLTSPYATRTFSSGTPGYSWAYATPWEYGERWVSPTYHHERISPRGWERYQTPPVVTGYTVRRPILVVPVAPPPPWPLWP